jgi:hypothetical protein
MVFFKGIKKTISEIDKSGESRKTINGIKICISCGKSFGAYSKKTETCGETKCARKAHNMKYHDLKSSPVEFKARKLFSTIRMGVGKKDKSLQ